MVLILHSRYGSGYHLAGLRGTVRGLGIQWLSPGLQSLQAVLSIESYFSGEFAFAPNGVLSRTGGNGLTGVREMPGAAAL